MTRIPRHSLAAAFSAVALVAAVGATIGERAAEPPLAAIVATGATATVAVLPDQEWRVELAALHPGDIDAAVAPDGLRVAFVSAREGNYELYVTDPLTGQAQRLTRSRVDDRRPSWSPDGRWLVWQSGPEGAADLLVGRAGGADKRLLVSGPGDDVDPAWSPDGTRIAFSSDRGGRRQLWAVTARGGEPVAFAEVPGRARAPAWSPGGRRIAFASEAEGGSDVWVLELGDGTARRLTRGPAWDSRPDWWPRGGRVAFARSHRGRTSLWVVREDGGRGREVDGSEGLVDPDWAMTDGALVPQPDELLPDLDQRTPAELAVIPAGRRFLLGFASSTQNRGVGPLVIRGTRSDDRAMRAHQVVELRSGGSRIVHDVGLMHYERHDPHFHWHLQSFVTFELWRADGRGTPVRDRKTGFCLIDRWGRVTPQVPGTGPPRFTGDCGAGQPNATRVEQGTSVGYIDRYGPFFHGQNVVVSGLPAGHYVLVHDANPGRVMRELAYSNNAASLLLELSWPNGRASAPRVAILQRCGSSDRCPPGDA
jgi:dipeptidyl aminopeptidase/acylaminoacyl peptidase